MDACASAIASALTLMRSATCWRSAGTSRSEGAWRPVSTPTIASVVGPSCDRAAQAGNTVSHSPTAGRNKSAREFRTRHRRYPASVGGPFVPKLKAR